MVNTLRVQFDFISINRLIVGISAVITSERKHCGKRYKYLYTEECRYLEIGFFLNV